MVPWYRGGTVPSNNQEVQAVSFKTLNKNEGGGAFYVFDLNFLSFFVCVCRDTSVKDTRQRTPFTARKSLCRRRSRVLYSLFSKIRRN